MSIQQTNQVILTRCHQFDRPLLNLLLRFGVLRVIEKAPHQPGKNSVVEEDGGVFQSLLAILRQLAGFQFRNGSKLVLGGGAELPLVVLVVEGATSDNSE